jgi:hypothetical protein
MSYSARIVCRFTEREVLLASLHVIVTDTVFILAAGESLVMRIVRINEVPPMLTVSLGKFVEVAFV